MSTATILQALEEGPEARFVRFPVRLRGKEKEHRKITLPSKMMDWLNEPTSDAKRDAWKAAIVVQFNNFCRGEKVYDCTDVKRVEDRRDGNDRYGHQVWAHGIRFSPQFRFFGMFLWTDHFIMFSKQSRANLDKTPALWHTEIDRCGRMWVHHFPGCLKFSGSRLSHYISHAEHCDARWTEH